MGNPATTNPAQEERYLAPATSLLRENSIQQRMALFEVEMPQRRLDYLIVPESTRRHIRALLTKIRYHRMLYEDFGLKQVDPRGGRTAINLYGPPGTGKSFTAEAIAHELEKGLIRVNYAEIESKFVGETPKNIKAAFLKAEECEALLFFDEADSILGKRLTSISQSTDHAVNVSRSVMLLALDSFSGVAVFASNLASNYDSAFVRRILGHIAMLLPDTEARAALWRGHIPAQLPVELSEQDWAWLAADSDGLSGGDILNCVINASAAAIEREGPGCTIRLADFRAAMQSARQAQAEIGVS